MKNTVVLFKKEVRSLFSSWIAYVVLIAFTMLSGITFYIYLRMYEILTRYADTVEEGVSRQSWNLVENLVHPVYKTVFVLLFIMVPAITMRLFAEEKRQRTDELLLTSPVRVGEIVVSKYLAAVLLVALMMIPVSIFPLILVYYGRPVPDWGSMATGYFGLVILGFSLVAIGVFASSLTENQIVAFIFTVALEMLFFIIAHATVTMDIIRIGELVFNPGSVLRTVSIHEHFDPLLSGLVRGSDLVYFVSLIGFWLWATKNSVESTRWG